MDKNLIDLTNKGLTIDTKEIAEMMEVDHSEILKKLDGTTKPDGSVKQVGIIPTLNEGEIPVVQYFVESLYKDAKGENRKCYLCTKLGCDLLANKFQGKKGILFSAKYVARFNQMEAIIKNKQIESANTEITELKEALSDFKRATEEAKLQYKPSHKRKLDYSNMIKSLTNNKEEYEAVKDWLFATLNIDKWEDTCIDDTGRIVDIITTVSRLLTIKRFEQLKLF